MAWPLLSQYDPRNDAISMKCDDKRGHDESSDFIFDPAHAHKKNKSGYINFLRAYQGFCTAEKLQLEWPVAKEAKSSVLLTEILSNSQPRSSSSTTITMPAAAAVTPINRPERQQPLPSSPTFCSGDRQVHPSPAHVSTSSLKSAIQPRSTKSRTNDKAAVTVPMTLQTSPRTRSAPPNRPTGFQSARVLLSQSQQQESSESILSPSTLSSPPPRARRRPSPCNLPPRKFTFRINATGMKYQLDPGSLSFSL